MVRYITRSGTEYEIDCNQKIIRNDILFKRNDKTFEYIGTTNFFESRETLLENALKNSGYTASTLITPNRLYEKFKNNEIFVKNTKYSDIKNHIDGKTSLMFISEDLEELIMTTPIYDSI